MNKKKKKTRNSKNYNETFVIKNVRFLQQQQQQCRGTLDTQKRGNTQKKKTFANNRSFHTDCYKKKKPLHCELNGRSALVYYITRVKTIVPRGKK